MASLYLPSRTFAACSIFQSPSTRTFSKKSHAIEFCSLFKTIALKKGDLENFCLAWNLGIVFFAWAGKIFEKKFLEFIAGFDATNIEFNFRF